MTKNAATVVLPPIRGVQFEDRSLRAWLAQSELTLESESRELLSRVLEPLALPYPADGLAALRMWGQTGDQPTTWIAAADPIYLEPRLDHLCVHALRRQGVPAREMRSLIDHLQSALGDDGDVGFARLGSYGYVRARSQFATAAVPAYVVDRQKPNEFLPTGGGSDAHRQLISEIEMAMHDHAVNLQRQEQGLQAVNSLWLWGGGIAPEQQTRPQPPLYSDDPLLIGYWYAATAVAEPWPGTIDACLEQSVAGFVAETPEFNNDPSLLETCLQQLRAALKRKRVSRVTMLFRDGLRAVVERKHVRRFWRRRSSLLD